MTFLGIVTLLLFAIKYIRMALLRPETWFVIAMLTFFICTGGVVYSIIHGVPWFKFDRNEYGQVYVAEYFMRGQRGQWAGEGYIVSALTVLTGFVLIFISRVNNFITKSF